MEVVMRALDAVMKGAKSRPRISKQESSRQALSP
jgi:hypothetical protein